MLKKKISILIIFIMFIFSIIFCIPHDNFFKVIEIKSPTEIILNNKTFKIQDLQSFDANFSQNNINLAKELNLSEEEAFAIGNLAKYWAQNLLIGHNVLIKNNDLIFVKYSYRTKFLYSGFCFYDNKPINKNKFNRILKSIRNGTYKVLDLNTDKIYKLSDNEVRSLNNYLVLRNSHIPKSLKNKSKKRKSKANLFFEKDNIKIIFSDSTTKIKPSRSCESRICKEILGQINNSQKSIDIAIYGYSKVPEVQEALISAINRGVQVRLIYDKDEKGNNIYPDTKEILNIIKQNKDDGISVDAKNIMHNKFYIFDNQILITGSANLSHTDMSGYNTNSIIVINSSNIAKIYKDEFEQMYNGKFHTEKFQTNKNKLQLSNTELDVYFSPQDKVITNKILPLIQNAKKYIYIPTFVLTEKRITEELIKAHQRGVDVKIIIDALNASIRHSKHNELRKGGLLVKTENYAGKMHSKSMIIDDEYTIIGSMNFSNSGENKNDENLIIIKDNSIAQFYKNFFLYQWSNINNRWLNSNVRAEGIYSIGSCFDGLDNNYDGLIDKDDPACKNIKY